MNRDLGYFRLEFREGGLEGGLEGFRGVYKTVLESLRGFQLVLTVYSPICFKQLIA